MFLRGRQERVRGLEPRSFASALCYIKWGWGRGQQPLTSPGHVRNTDCTPVPLPQNLHSIPVCLWFLSLAWDPSSSVFWGLGTSHGVRLSFLLTSGIYLFLGKHPLSPHFLSFSALPHSRPKWIYQHWMFSLLSRAHFLCCPSDIILGLPAPK